MNKLQGKLIWLKTEYKRAALMLPAVLKRAVIPIVMFFAAIGMIAFCAFQSIQSSNEDTRVHIGYVAQDDMITRLAVSYVESMESVKSLCSLESTTLEEGKRLLEENELSALIVLPENVVNEILSGSNTPATVYLPQSVSGNVTGSRIFEELANAGIGMLQTAQAEIYAATDLSASLGQDAQLQEIYDDINRYNLNVVGSRARIFENIILSATENNSIVVYYAGAFLTVYALVIGVFFGGFCKRTGLQQRMIKRRVGISYFGQLVSRILAVMPLLALVLILPLLLPLLPDIGEYLSYARGTEDTARLVAAAFICLVFAAIYVQLVYQLVEEAQGAIIIFGLSAVFQGYMSGCIIPSALLPSAVAAVGKYLPAAYMRAGFTMLFTGNMENFSTVICGLAVWSAVCIAAVWGTMHYMGSEDDIIALKKTTRVSFKTPLFLVMLKRLLRQKSLWVCLCLTVVISAVVAEAERNSETVVYAAVYDEGERFVSELSDYDGLVHFVICESEDEVKRLVLRGDVECGYVLSEELGDKLMSGRARNLITVYEDGDSVVARVVDEVLFEMLFEHTSLEWFDEYISAREGFESLSAQTIEAAARAHLAGNTTFRLRIERLGVEKESGESVTFPVHYAVALGVMLCAVQGIAQTVIDARKNRFYKRSRAAMAAITIIQPVILGLAAGVATLLAVYGQI